MLSVFLLALFLVAAIPHNAHAYLDPASGNALVASLIAMAGISLYMCKSLFYKIINRQPSSTTQFTDKEQTLGRKGRYSSGPDEALPAAARNRQEDR